MSAYVDSLSDGLASNPQCMMKASVLRVFFENMKLGPLVPLVPKVLGDLITSPPPASVWVPEVHATALFLAATDAIFLSDDVFIEHSYTNNYRLLDSIMYRFIFRTIGVRRLTKQIGDRWSVFHRGTDLSVYSFDEAKRVTVLHLLAPAGHVPPLFARAYGSALRASIEIAGERNVRCESRTLDATTVEYECSWEK